MYVAPSFLKKLSNSKERRGYAAHIFLHRSAMKASFSCTVFQRH